MGLIYSAIRRTLIADRAVEHALAFCLGTLLFVGAFLLTGDITWGVLGAAAGITAAVLAGDERAHRRDEPSPICMLHRPELPPLTPTRQARLARTVIGLLLMVAAWPILVVSLPAACFTFWVGLSHLVAAASGYPGCPEIGAFASLVLGRPVASGCGPWCLIDRRLG